ncbi:NAD(P)-binding domain-containing protein [Thalassotalea litorea]|uniref:NAD(P)-binding domain-containing protein n=1 Tax=Thalassotalea litorea TaxID=2020715 RepID=UPI0037356C4D
MKHKSVAIIGAGWLGLPLAQSLQDNGCDVLVTATSDAKVATLKAQGLNAVCYQAKPDSDGCENQHNKRQVFAKNVVVICIPPRIRHGDTTYPEIIAQVVKDANATDSQVSQLILCSSTAVYNGLAGEVDETSSLNMAAEKTAILARAEQQVLTSLIPLPQVIRLGGLIGANRHPGRFFREGRVIPNPESSINFIHQDDVISIISYLIEHTDRLSANIVNVVAPAHPSRRTFYQYAHRVIGRDSPEFSEQVEKQGKVVQPNVLLNHGYEFKYDDVLSWLLQTTTQKQKQES